MTHHAIAELMERGFVRIVVTTNFDRLLEHAIGERGIAPKQSGSSSLRRAMVPSKAATAPAEWAAAGQSAPGSSPSPPKVHPAAAVGNPDSVQPRITRPAGPLGGRGGTRKVPSRLFGGR